MSAGVPGPWRITFDTNPDDCNLTCVMCEEHSEFSNLRRLRMAGHRPHRRMDVRIIRKVVAEMAPRGLREIIPSTMGEPLLFAEFDEILEVCRTYGVKLNLTTNGTWPHRGPERWGELLCPLTSDVKVSWNGADSVTQESIMKGSVFEQRIQGLRAFLGVRDRIAKSGANRCRVTLQCTFMERNLEELPGLVELAASLGIDRVKGHHLWVHFGELTRDDLRGSAESRRRWNQARLECLKVAERHPRPDGVRILLDNFLPLPESGSFELPVDWECPFLEREAWVNYAGRFDPCCAPDAERKSLGEFGEVTAKTGMTGIWDGPAYRRLSTDYRSRPVCCKCTLRRPVTTSS